MEKERHGEMSRIAEKSYYVKELASEECICGATKRRGFSFCYNCYYALPVHMRQRLYAKVGQGYERQYENAVAELVSQGSI